MTRSKYHAFIQAACLAAITLLAASCLQNELVQTPTNTDTGEGFALTFSSDPMKEYKVGTRSSDAKDDDEKRINTLHIFFFTQEGQWLTGSYLTGYPDFSASDGGYIAPSQGTTLIKIANQSGSFGEGAEDAIVYAVANVENTLFQDKDSNGRPKVLQDAIDNGTATTPLEALQTLVYRPLTLITSTIPSTGMPMAGNKTVNLTTTPAASGDERVIELKALMARIDVDISLESKITDNNLPSMLLTKWTAVNMPRQVSLTETAAGGTTTGLTDDTKTTFSSESTQLIYNRGEHINFSFYMFENMQQPQGPISYPSGENGQALTDTQKQRYKPHWANANAAYVQFKTQYTTYNNATCEVTYKLYLGSDHVDNYEVKRNHQYKNNIVIKGLTAHDTNDGETGEYTYDARVNIEETNNKYYISILRERNHDAHFCVTPMDVYFFDEAAHPSITVTFLNDTDLDNGQPWIRMEKIPAINMEEGTLPGGMTEDDHLIAGSDFTAGHGKRSYFTTDLVTNTLATKGQSVTIDANRDRVYFYIDENLSASQDRTAVVQLTYTDDNGNSTRTLDITQTHFRRVDIRETYKGNEMDGAKFQVGDWTFYRNNPIYMEAYEEYLDHYDPLDDYSTTTIYAGLPWEEAGYNITGLDNVNARYYFESIWHDPLIGGGREEGPDYATTDTEPSHNWYQGYEFTNQIIERAGQGVMTLNGKPRSAAEYCYNRNKRNSNGEVSDGSKKYFLPGIRQMESSLTAYYNEFPEFQNNYYWSSSIGERWAGTSGVNNERARATKIKANGTYESSGGGDGDGTRYAYEYFNENGERRGGYALRNTELRIRAFRVDLEPITE